MIDPDAKMNIFTWYKQDNYWIVQGDKYNEELKNCQGPIHNGQFLPRTLKNKRRTDRTCSKFSGSVRFNGIQRGGNLIIFIRYYKYQCHEHMIRNGMWYIFPYQTPAIKKKMVYYST